jgi:hypothetical protein
MFSLRWGQNGQDPKGSRGYVLCKYNLVPIGSHPVVTLTGDQDMKLLSVHISGQDPKGIRGELCNHSLVPIDSHQVVTLPGDQNMKL